MWIKYNLREKYLNLNYYYEKNLWQFAYNVYIIWHLNKHIALYAAGGTPTCFIFFISSSHIGTYIYTYTYVL